jgi:hypothetical protein
LQTVDARWAYSLFSASPSTSIHISDWQYKFKNGKKNIWNVNNNYI